jgi:methylenetetrahydrofolate reductase (NADPH)
VHIHSPSLDQDIRVMKEKVANGARFLITQLFFDNELYFDFVDKVRAAGVDVPIIPGIMPIQAYGQIKRITKMCGATIPAELEHALSERQDDEAAVRDLGVAYATLQCADLLGRGAPGIHFYVMNRSPAARAVLAALRAARPWERALQLV